MRVSLSIVKQYIDFELPPVDELVARINQQLGGVEEVVDLGAKYKDAVIVRVVEAEQHPNADRLRVCKVDDGGVVADAPRDENGYVQVVCGAPNAVAGMTAVWLPPKSTVPASYDEAEPFVLSARELRGVLSQGMLAAADELGIGTDHSGIIEIDPDEWKPGDIEIKPGVSFAAAYGLDDYAIDIENKMFTHRPDCFGQLGVAREIAGILGQKFEDPDWYWLIQTFEKAEGLNLEVFNDVPEKVPRFMAVAMKDVTIKPSPLWLQCALVVMGSKAINNVVDVTNYAMLLTAQPSHAYDYDKLQGHKLGARMAQAGETATLLNGKTYELTSDDIVIADAEGVVGLAGIMGGGTSEVSDSTTNIVLEVGVFDMYAVRKTSMRYGLFTEALTRFNKGQSSLVSDRTFGLVMRSLTDVSGAVQASDVYDIDTTIDAEGRRNINTERAIKTQFINDRLGLSLTDDEIAALLRNVHFACYPEEPGDLRIAAPDWRTDIVDPEDIVEEVGRLYGFDKLPRELPSRTMKPTTVNTTRLVKQAVRDSLRRSGANEVLTYSFVHENIIKKAEQMVAKAFQLGNALSPDLQYYRLSVLPSLLDKVHMNIKAGHDEFALYEIGKAHHKDEFDDEGLPREFGRVAGVYASKKPGEGAPYYQVKQLLGQIVADFGVREAFRYQKLSEFDFGEHDALRQLAAPFDPERSSMVYYGEKFGGVIGEFKQSVGRGFKLPEYAAGFELFVSLFENLYKTGRAYTPLSRFPSVTQDISLRVDEAVKYEKVYQTVLTAATEQAGDGIAIDIAPVTIYQPDNESTKTVTLRLTATSYERTLRDEDVKPLLEHAAGKALETVGATLV